MMTFEWHEAENRFYVTNEKGEEIAEITFRYGENQRVSVNHTYVNPDYRGQQIAEKLVDLVVTRLRKEGCKIVPTCSYVAKRMSRVEAYQDMLAQ